MNTPGGNANMPGASEHPPDLYRFFGLAAELHPDRPAIEFNGEPTSYRDLERLANGVADAIVDRCLEPGARVGLLAAREVSAYAAYLGILKAGCTVVPLSVDAPPSRLLAACSSAGIRLVFGVGKQRPPLGERGIEYVDAREIQPAGSAPCRPSRRHDVAYILFTSGSTGTPKGVPILHGSAAQYVAYAGARLGVTVNSRTSHEFDLTFDPSVFDLFCTWAAGATLVVPARHEQLMPANYVNQRRISHWFSVPSVISLADKAGEIDPDSMPALECSQFIGEQLTAGQAKAWADAAPNSRILNSYGPTELTVACTDYELARDPESWPSTSNDTIPIGTVYPHLEHLVLDDDGCAASDGELCVRGNQRFNGYLDPEDNRGRFLSYDGDTLALYADGDITAELWYRTGDHVRYESGTLVHIGRLDRQTKVQGYRIELGEIEVALRRLPEITQAVVSVVDLDYSRGICATLVGRERTDAEMRASLAKELPKYMIPTIYSWSSELPLKGNGKVDYGAIGREAQRLAALGSRLRSRPESEPQFGS